MNANLSIQMNKVLSQVSQVMAKQKEFECSFGPPKEKCVASEAIDNIGKIPQTSSDSYSSQNVGTARNLPITLSM